MSKTMRVIVTGEAPYRGEGKNGKPFVVSNVYALDDVKPFPQELGVFEEVALPTGEYDVPYLVVIFNGRAGLRFDFARAVRAEKKVA